MRFLTAIFVLFLSSPLLASPFEAFERCIGEIEVGDMVAAKSSALELAQLMPSSSAERIELGLLCLQKVYGSERSYDPNLGSFTTADSDARLEFKNDLISLDTTKSIRYADRLNSATLSALEASWKKEKADLEIEKADLEIEQVRLQNQLTCAEQDLSLVQQNLSNLLLEIRSANNSVIVTKTKDACERLNSSDPDAAILNPICRQWFQDNFHPDLELAEAASKINIMTEKVRNHQGIVDGLQLPLALLMVEMAELQMKLAGALKAESQNAPNEYAVLDCSTYKN